MTEVSKTGFFVLIGGYKIDEVMIKIIFLTIKDFILFVQVK